MSTQAHRSVAPGAIPVWEFSDKIRKARDTTGLGQKEFAARIDLNPSSLAAYETGRATPRFRDAPGLAKRLQLLTGIPADWFLVVDDPNTPAPPAAQTDAVNQQTSDYKAAVFDLASFRDSKRAVNA